MRLLLHSATHQSPRHGPAFSPAMINTPACLEASNQELSGNVAPRPTQSMAIPGYRVLDKIGEGGMGEVRRAVQLSLQRTVAIKFLNQVLPNQSEPGSFKREARMMAAISHPHVVTIYDCGQVGDRNFLVIEYLQGSTLRSRMKPGVPWLPRDAASVLGPVASALSYIHARGLLHLDLKPENVLCADDGRVKITDFGLASARVDVRIMVEQGIARGSVEYCSPEQRYGLPLDERSDVYSLAALAYELLTGHPTGRVYLPASLQNPRLSPAVDKVLRRGLERDLDERYTCVRDFHSELARALAPPERGMSAWFAAVVIGMLLLAALLMITGYCHRKALQDRPSAPARSLQVISYPGRCLGISCRGQVCDAFAQPSTRSEGAATR
jgi:serine/threonine protein kinase